MADGLHVFPLQVRGKVAQWDYAKQNISGLGAANTR
jgi:hypothetical protein